MASQAHCAYCFETLAASLEKRHHLSLRQVELLWAKYDDSDEDEAGRESEDMETDAANGELGATDGHQTSYRPAAISRLLVSPSSSSSSSSAPSTNSSTP